MTVAAKDKATSVSGHCRCRCLVNSHDDTHVPLVIGEARILQIWAWISARHIRKESGICIGGSELLSRCVLASLASLVPLAASPLRRIYVARVCTSSYVYGDWTAFVHARQRSLQLVTLNDNGLRCSGPTPCMHIHQAINSLLIP